MSYRSEIPSDLAWCECGRPKSRKKECCTRCTFLDGTPNHFDIVSALRLVGDASINDLVEITGRKHRDSVELTMKRMMRGGRVRRYWQDGKGGCWIYRLTETPGAFVDNKREPCRRCRQDREPGYAFCQRHIDYWRKRAA